MIFNHPPRVSLGLCAALILGSLAAGCGSTAPTKSTPPAAQRYLEPGSKLISNTYLYTFEQLSSGRFCKKTYLPENNHLVSVEQFLDEEATILHGKTAQFSEDEDCLTSITQYINGKKQGESVQIACRSQKVVRRSFFNNDLLEGPETRLDSTGTYPLELYYYLAGKKHGRFKEWSAPDTLLREGLYLNDSLIEQTVYVERPDKYHPQGDFEQPQFCLCPTSSPNCDQCGNEYIAQFLQKNVKYPPLARKNGAMGTALVSFVVDKDGSITQVKMLRSITLDIRAECLRVVGLMPKWRPGSLNGEPIKVRYTLPITFRLE